MSHCTPTIASRFRSRSWGDPPTRRRSLSCRSPPSFSWRASTGRGWRPRGEGADGEGSAALIAQPLYRQPQRRALAPLGDSVRTPSDSIASRVMEVDVAETPPEGVEADVLGFPVTETLSLPALARAPFAQLGDDGELRGERGAVTLVHRADGIAAARLAAAGVGAGQDADDFRTAAAELARRVGGVGSGTVAWLLEDDGLPLTAAEQVRAVVDGLALGAYDAGRWKTNGDRRGGPSRLIFCGPAAA